MAKILDGKAVAEAVKKSVKAGVDAFKSRSHITPGLATVLVGQDAASQVYIKNKVRTTEACGMVSIHHDLRADTSEADLLKLLVQLNHDARVHGILVQMPLPKHINEQKIINAILPQKDVDGFHPVNMGKLLLGQDGFKPCTPAGVMKILEHYGLDVRGKDAIVVGRSGIVGKPMAALLVNASATVTLAHSQTQNLAEKISRADLVVAAIGKPLFIRGEWIKSGAVVIDVGINRLPDGSLCGDVDFSGAENRASCITPVPGGVGPMTIAMLMQNTLKAAEQAGAGSIS